MDLQGLRVAITGAALTAASIVDCVRFAVTQPRDNFLRELHFEQTP